MNASPASADGAPDAGRAPERAPDAHGWPYAWAELARAARIGPQERLLLALSGGADSVFLLHLLADARPRPALRVVHVQHGVRGDEGELDARFCAALCAERGLEFRCRELALSAAGPSLEARARTARYRALAEEARACGARTILTGHHADDALETLLLRLLRGTDAPGLAGPLPRTELGPELDPTLAPGLPPIALVRPLLGLRREEVRALLRHRGLAWREDGSNQDRRHARNRVRLDLIPLLEQLGGQGALEELRVFAREIERFEDELARATAHLAWEPLPHASGLRAPSVRRLGGRIARAQLAALPAPLLRRALWRLLRAGSGHAPSREQLQALSEALVRGRCATFNLRGDWHAWLRAEELVIVPPQKLLGRARVEPRSLGEPLPFEGGAADPGAELELPVPGQVLLPDGRRLVAEPLAPGAAEAGPQRPAHEAELDAADLPERLYVRWMKRGDRFHPLGAPGQKPLARFLSGQGVPREERARVPLVCAAGEILWVAGLRPSHRHRVRAQTRERLLLKLLDATGSAETA